MLRHFQERLLRLTAQNNNKLNNTIQYTYIHTCVLLLHLCENPSEILKSTNLKKREKASMLVGTIHGGKAPNFCHLREKLRFSNRIFVH